MVHGSGTLTAWVCSRPPADLPEVAAHPSGAVIVPTVTVIESSNRSARYAETVTW